MHQRPKTSKGTRKEGKNQNLTGKLFKNMGKDSKQMRNLNANINNLLGNHSTGVTRQFNGGFDRPASVMEGSRKGKVAKIHDAKKPKSGKTKLSKSTRGGTPAPPIQNRCSTAATALAVRSSASGFIERSSSNEVIRSGSRFKHHTNESRTRKGSAKKRGTKFNMNIHDKSVNQTAKSSDRK